MRLTDSMADRGVYWQLDVLRIPGIRCFTETVTIFTELSKGRIMRDMIAAIPKPGRGISVFTVYLADRQVRALLCLDLAVTHISSRVSALLDDWNVTLSPGGEVIVTGSARLSMDRPAPLAIPIRVAAIRGVEVLAGRDLYWWAGQPLSPPQSGR